VKLRDLCVTSSSRPPTRSVFTPSVLDFQPKLPTLSPDCAKTGSRPKSEDRSPRREDSTHELRTDRSLKTEAHVVPPFRRSGHLEFLCHLCLSSLGIYSSPEKRSTQPNRPNPSGTLITKDLDPSDQASDPRPIPVRQASQTRPRRVRPVRERFEFVRDSLENIFQAKKPGLRGPTLQTKHLQKTRTGSDPVPAGSEPVFGGSEPGSAGSKRVRRIVRMALRPTRFGDNAKTTLKTPRKVSASFVPNSLHVSAEVSDPRAKAERGPI
jgi:hypothetical protein